MEQTRRVVLSLVIAVCVMHRNGICGQMCSARQNFQHVNENTAITGSTFLTLKDLGLVGCSKQCLLRSGCQSFNYEPRTQECQLNRNRTESENIKEVVGTLSSDITSWSHNIAGVCRSRDCQTNAVCVEENNDKVCKTECPNPTLQNGTFTSPISHHVGDVLSFECDTNFKATGEARCRDDGTWGEFDCILGCINPPTLLNAERLSAGNTWPIGSTLEYVCLAPLEKIGTVRCLPDGTWTEMKCVARNCSSVLQCNNDYSDGEYWIYPEVLNDEPLKIYCHDMGTENPLEYLTLPEETYIDFPDVCPNGVLQDCESTTFFKVRITDIVQLSIDFMGMQDVSFSNRSTRCLYVLFGLIYNCHNSCNEPKSTDLVINTKGTGLKLDRERQWISESEITLHDPVTTEVTDSGRHIRVKCYQPCGYCYPETLTLAFVVDDDHVVDIPSAISPSC